MKTFFLILTFSFLSITLSASDYTILTGQVENWGYGGIPVPTFTGNLILEAGARLIISSTTVSMQASKYIILTKNSKLIIDNSIIQKANQGATHYEWGGIRFDNSNIGSYDIPGCVFVDNSTIQDAILVFRNLNSQGGGVRATNTKFFKNLSVADISGILSSPYQYGNIGFTRFCFTLCDFYNVVSCGGSNQQFFYFKDVRNINFRGCGFYNLGEAKIAIKALNCKITVDGYLDIKSNQITRGVFSGFPSNPYATYPGLGCAISIKNNLTDTKAKVVIANCDFKASTFDFFDYLTNDKAISLQGCANPEIYSNIIEPSQNNTNTKHGIYLDGCSGFKVENNRITALSEISSYAPYVYGIVILNSGIETNQIYRNYLYDCGFGIQAEGKNRGSAGAPDDPSQGLKLLCNEFSSFNTAYYMTAVGCSTPPCDVDYSISEWQQGALPTSAASPNFNLTPDRNLTGTEYDFNIGSSIANTGFNIQYVTPTNPGNYTINDYTPNTINVSQHPTITPATAHCESRLPYSGPIGLVAVDPTSLQHNGVYVSNRSLLHNLVNAGNHDSLYNVVLNVTSANVSQVYNGLISSTPSHDILALACENKIFTPLMIKDILIENTYGIKKLF